MKEAIRTLKSIYRNEKPNIKDGELTVTAMQYFVTLVEVSDVYLDQYGRWWGTKPGDETATRIYYQDYLNALKDRC